MIPFSLFYLIMMLSLTLFYWIVPEGMKKKCLIVSGFIVAIVIAPKVIPYLALSVILSFFVTRYLTTTTGHKKKRVLWMGIFLNVAFFILYQWKMPFIGVENERLFISIGAFFLLLQNISCWVESYRDAGKQLNGFQDYILYIMFFPKLLVGPIQNPNVFLKQFQKPALIDKNKIVEGLYLIAWGIFQKMAIADRLGILADRVFLNPGQHFGVELILASVCLFLQLYCDYCAFVDISVGCSRMMNIELEHHFNMPIYMNRERSFWRHYHMPLRQWFENYIMSPFSSKKKKNKGKGQLSLIQFYSIQGISLLSAIVFVSLIRCLSIENAILYTHNIFRKIPNGFQWGKLCLDLGFDTIGLLKVFGAIFILWFVSTWQSLRKRKYPESIYYFRQLNFWKIAEINFLILSFLLLGVFESGYFIARF